MTHLSSVNATRRVPRAVNEPIKSYAPGSPERAELKARLASMSNERVDIPLIIGLYQQDRFKLDEMITRTYPLEDWEQAMHDMHAGELARGVLLF